MKLGVFFFFVMRSVSFSSTPWPDPNSPVLSKFDFGVPLPELFKWLDIRDKLLGRCYKEQDITSALALARDCKHPDAEWLTSIFEGKDVSTEEQARQVCLLHEDDARALGFAWFMDKDYGSEFFDLTLARRAAEMGNAFACCLLFWQVCEETEDEAFRLAQTAAAKLERDGFLCLGYAFEKGIGCEKDLTLAKENYYIASELGDPFAPAPLRHMTSDEDPVHWLVMGKAKRLQESFVLNIYVKLIEFFSGSGNASVAFAIGCVLKGNINMEDKKVFGREDIFLRKSVELGNRAVSFYDAQIKSARLAVDTWTLVATRLHVIKDMRIYIGKMIWAGRSEANYLSKSLSQLVTAMSMFERLQSFVLEKEQAVREAPFEIVNSVIYDSFLKIQDEVNEAISTIDSWKEGFNIEPSKKRRI